MRFWEQFLFNGYYGPRPAPFCSESISRSADFKPANCRADTGGSIKSRISYCVFVSFFLVQPPLFAASSANGIGGVVDVNYYPYLSDIDNDAITTVNLSASLGQRLSYFSLSNLSNDSGSKALQDINNYFSEQNLRWQIAEGSPFDLTLQMNFRSGEDNDRYRLGVRWRLHQTSRLADFFNSLHMSYSLNLHAVQFDSEAAYVWQIEHVFRLKFPYLSDRLYLAGFLDHTFNQDLPAAFPDSPIVAEVQLGYRIYDNFHLISEYRINEYRRRDVNNFAAGLQYKFNW